MPVDTRSMCKKRASFRSDAPYDFDFLAFFFFAMFDPSCSSSTAGFGIPGLRAVVHPLGRDPLTELDHLTRRPQAQSSNPKKCLYFRNLTRVQLPINLHSSR